MNKSEAPVSRVRAPAIKPFASQVDHGKRSSLARPLLAGQRVALIRITGENVILVYGSIQMDGICGIGYSGLRMFSSSADGLDRT
jgi:hypothetical protein